MFMTNGKTRCHIESKEQLDISGEFNRLHDGKGWSCEVIIHYLETEHQEAGRWRNCQKSMNNP